MPLRAERRRLATAVLALALIGGPACALRGMPGVAGVTTPTAVPSTAPPPTTASPFPQAVASAPPSPTPPSATAGVPERVYVPNEMSRSVSVIDPKTRTVVQTIAVGEHPEHVTPDWDLQRLYVNDRGLTAIDPRTGATGPHVPVRMPYNLYFTPDGTQAIVVAEDLNRLDFFDRLTWTPIASVPIPWRGVNHLDFSLDGSYLLASTEYTGRVVKVDTRTHAITGSLFVGGLPIDVRLAPDGSVFFVSNQGRHGVSVIDAGAMREVAFVPTGRGAHGLQLSRDGRLLYVSDRLAGAIAVITIAERTVSARWAVGGSPDMLQLSPDGSELWSGNRFGNTVSVIDTGTGAVLARITVGRAPHGLTYFPQPGRYSIGHNGVYR